MVPRIEPKPSSDPNDRDEQLGEAIEAYLALAETGAPPDPEEFARRYPEFSDDLLAALEGLALVEGLVGEAAGHGRLESGRRIAGYRIVRELGRGGMGIVYEAVHVGLDRPVALKVLGMHAAPDSTGRRRFLNEAKTAAGLHHTHIVPVFDVGQVGGLCYYAMQRIEGCGLDRVIRHLRRDRPTAAGMSSLNPTPLLSRLGLRLSPVSWSRPAAPRGSTSETASWAGRDLAVAASKASAALSRSGLLAPAGRGAGLDLDMEMELDRQRGRELDRDRDRDRDDEPPPFDPPRGSAYYRWVADVGRQAAEALAHAHHLGVIHRDMKPSNLLVDSRGLVWVADFGLARRLADPGLTQHDSLLGTPRYMSPEQARVGPIDGRSDLFSLGATLYELLVLRPPFEGQSAAELVEQIKHNEPLSPRQFDTRIPRDLETIVLKLLAKRPADRYASAQALADDLARFLNYEPVHARRISVLGRVWRFAQRRPGITLVSTASLLTVLTVSTVAYLQILNHLNREIVLRNEAQKARDNALIAQNETRAQRDEALRARGEAQSALRTSLLHQAQTVRLSNLPNRRAEGLGYIGQAAKLKPEPALQAQLRNEAVEFLLLRDAEERAPFPIERGRLAFSLDGKRLGVLSFTSGGLGRSLGVWDVAKRERLNERPLREPSEFRVGPPLPGSAGGRRGGGPGGGFGLGLSSLVAVDHCFAVITPDNQGIRFFEDGYGARFDDLKLAGRQIRFILLSPEGQRLVTIEEVRADRTEPAEPMTRLEPPPPTWLVNLWDTENLEKPLENLSRWEFEPGQRGFPLVAMSPDGKVIATALSQKTTVSLWEAETGKALGPIDTQVDLNTLALGPDNLMATSDLREVRLWDLETHTSMDSIRPNLSFVRSLRFSPRGSLLAIVGRDAELWDTSAHASVATLRMTKPIDELTFSPDGQTVVATAQQSNEAAVWEVVDSEARVQISGFDALTRSMAFRPDGLLALGTWKGSIRFWKDGHCVSGAQEHEASAAPANEAAGADENDKEEEKPVHESLVAFDYKGRLVTLDADALKVWNNPPECSQGVRLPLEGTSGLGGGPTLRLASSLDGRTMLISRRRQILSWHADAPDRLDPVNLAPNSGEPSQMGDRFDRPRRNGPGRGFGGLVVAPQGDRFYLIEAFRVRALELQGGVARERNWSSPTGDATSLALSPDGRILAVGDSTGVVTLLNTDDGSLHGRLVPGENDPKEWIWSLAFSPDGQKLAIGTHQGVVMLRSVVDLDDPTPPLILPGHAIITSLAFDPSGEKLASAADRTVTVWNLSRIREEFVRLGLEW